MNLVKYWVAVISKDHTIKGVEGQFIQVCHGKQAPLKRMKKDDWIIIYSPKCTMAGTEKLQQFTAIGKVSDESVYSFKMAENFIPFRRNITFYSCEAVSILPLIPELEFIVNKRSWGFPFRFGFFEINEHDFNLILPKMITDENNGKYI